MDREELLLIIDAAYSARASGDPAELEGFWAPGATFELAGDNDLLADFPADGRGPGHESIAALMELVEFKAFTRLDAVVEGRRASVLWHATVSFAGREPFDTMLYDLFELTDDGKVQSVLQFVDTARIAAEMRALAGD